MKEASKMPRIRIEWLATRTDEQRRELARKITDVFIETIQIPKEQVNIIFEEIDPKLYAKGGTLWSDILGKKE
jgi:4-oxalocrotonate tautomerase